ncbi:leucine rich repeat domain-containing protein [Histoplasma capsulatum]|uniref:Leucine rich repeat domain-containing protein n=1 Tax=Ajellomyces capsulatus TaxID=5037 RepID=A0A8A1MAN8_AJECA|nr:conserved hypothetical protein [Histoplasma mississippiense (nom. inval.)]EDN08332.1 conserved hypothetical protein [Histoplasma mississippiense (nom. inval.)]QSS61552.1 leucine rich repeat domain-containing protein [Histoplasma capsulatum]
MEKLNTEDGQLFIKNLASFVRTHEKALANALQMKRQSSKTSDSSTRSATSSTLAAAFSLGTLSFTSHNIKPAKLTLTGHHLFYLLSRFEDISIPVGPMNIRLENINTEASSAYVSFLSKPRRSAGDRDSIHSVSSVRSVMSSMSSLWSSFGLGSKDPVSKSEKAKLAIENDLKYLYSAFTKIPFLRLSPDHRARLIHGYEEFPFDTAVPLYSFKNLSALEIIDVDFRSFCGWDRLAEQLRSLTLKRASIDDPADLLTGIVLDDLDKRRRRSSKYQSSPVLTSPNGQASNKSELAKSISTPGSPVADLSSSPSSSPKASTSMTRGFAEGGRRLARTESISPTRPNSSKQQSRRRGTTSKVKRSGSGSSNSSDASSHYRTRSMSNLLAAGILPPSKWRFLRHLSLTDNSMTSVSAASLAPVANTLHSLDLSWNLFTEIPDSLASLTAMRSLNLSHCMIDSLHSLSRNPLPAITALNLRGNRLRSLAGIERLLSLERLDLRDNELSDPSEIARLTGIPYLREIWVSGNPFTKTFSEYRVSIFNLFRQTPGFSEDIIIDTTGPGYTERKQLVARVAEPEGAPVVRHSGPGDDPADETQDIPLTTSSAAAIRAGTSGSVAAAHAEQAISSTRRKKSYRRKIVELSDDNPFHMAADGAKAVNTVFPQPIPEHPVTNPASTTEQLKSPYKISAKIPNAKQPQRTTITTFTTPKESQCNPIFESTKRPNLLPAIQSLDWSANGDSYRQRLEALKHEVGTNWLTVLGDESWDTSQNDINSHTVVGSEYSPVGPLRPSLIPRTSSQAIATGGRTVG